MSYKIGIIGLGNVGISYAYSLINQGLDIGELILIGIDEKKTQGKALDLSHSLSFSRGYINNVKLGKYEDISDADILCITAGVPQTNKKRSRMEDLNKTNKIITGITIKDLYKDKTITFSSSTEVKFRELTDEEINWYVEGEKNIFNIKIYFW